MKPWVVTEGGALPLIYLYLQKLAVGTWNVTSSVDKESELKCKFKRYQLDIVCLIATKSMGSRTNLLERGWTLFHSRVAHG